jgi:hypothetical protein
MDTAGRGGTMDDSFHQLDDLVLHLKGLVLARRYRERNGADAEELDMFGAEIDRVRDRLADLVRSQTLDQAAA